MQYQFTERYEFIKSIEFKNSNPLQNVQAIRFFKEEEISGVFVNKRFRYSFDNAIWSNWIDLTQNNLSSIQFKNNPNFWLQIIYDRTSVNSGNIQRWYLYYDSDVVTPSDTSIDASIDATTFAGQLPSYYLNRENHYGPYTDLNIENVYDGSAIGVYYDRLDNSSGTTFFFKTINTGTNDVSITESNGQIYIGFDKTFIDSSLSQLFLIYGNYESSIAYLTNWNFNQDSSFQTLDYINFLQDTSIIYLTQITKVQDNSINNLNNKLFIVETSVNFLKQYDNIQDISINNLNQLNSLLDGSAGKLSKWNLIQDLSLNFLRQWNINQDNSLLLINDLINKIDSSILLLNNKNSINETSLGNLTTWNSRLDTSIINLTNWNKVEDLSIVGLRQVNTNQDSSILLLNSRINTINSSLNLLDNVNAIQDSSLYGLTQWNKLLDNSSGNLSQWNKRQDASINNLIVNNNKLDVSVNNLVTKQTQTDQYQSIQDSSIATLTAWNSRLDTSTINLTNWNKVEDLSIVGLRQVNVNQEVSINNLIVNQNQISQYNIIQDTSISNLNTYKNLHETSLGNLTNWNKVEDLSIVGLRQVNVNQEASINDLITTQSLIKQYDTIQDASLSNLNTYKNLHETSLGNLTNWNKVEDLSIVGLRQVNINQDSSISQINTILNNIDNSLNILNNINSLQDSSLYGLTQWDKLLDVSAGNLTNWNKVEDLSIVGLRQVNTNQETSINNLIVNQNQISQYNIIQDASISNLNTYKNLHETSLGNLTNWNKVEDASIISIKNTITNINASINVISNLELLHEASLGKITEINNIQDASIKKLFDWNLIEDNSIIKLLQNDLIQDSSINTLNNKVNTLDTSVIYLQNEQVKNIGDGSAHIYSNRDASSNILLKTIKTLGPVTLHEDASVITIDTSIVKLYDSNIEHTAFTPYTVGGIQGGTSILSVLNETYTSILDKILFPTIDPCIIEPSATFTFNSELINLAYSNNYITFICNFDRGTINIDKVFENYRAGLPYEYVFTGLDISGNFASSSLTYSFIDEPVNVPLGVTSWTAQVKYNGGPQPTDSRGNSFGTPLDSSITHIKTIYTEGVWPLYATSSNINIMSEQQLYSMKYSDEVILELVSESNGYKQRFDIPDEWINSPTNKPLLGIQTYSEIGELLGLTDKWDYQGGNVQNAFSYWDVSTYYRTINAHSVKYITYKYNGVDRSAIKIKLLF